MQATRLRLASQQGVGLIEVLISVLLLAIGILGFAGLQIKSLAVTSESAQKTQALNLVATLSDRTRVNPNLIGLYAAALNQKTQTPSTCIDCNAVELVTKDVSDIKKIAANQHMTLHMETCKSTSSQWCMFVAWDKTNISTSGYGTDPNTACMTETSTYWANATCLMMEMF